MSKICVNNAVIDKYRSGMNINDALSDVFHGEIQDKIAENDAFSKMTPMQMVMHDAGITKYSTLGDIMNTAYTSGGMDSNEWLFPTWVETTIREAAYAQNIISYLCDTTIGVDSNIVKSATLDMLSADNKPNVKKARVAEGADLPVAKIRIGDKAITLWKHGRAIELTYEAARRMRIDLFTKHMNAIISDIAFQNLDAAVDVLAKGDGNNNAAVKIGTLATDNTITAAELAGFLIDYWNANHYSADTLTCPIGFYKQLVGMTYDPTLAEGASMRVKFNTPQLGEQNLTILCADVPKIGSKDALLLSSKSNTLIRYEENGSNIQENQNFARNQTRLLTASENSGYAINMTGSNMYIENKTT